MCQEHHLEGYVGYPHLLISFDDATIRLHRTAVTQSNAIKTHRREDCAILKG